MTADERASRALVAMAVTFFTCLYFAMPINNVLNVVGLYNIWPPNFIPP